jgi:HSP20 family molecular chaperone IbpA
LRKRIEPEEVTNMSAGRRDMAKRESTVVGAPTGREDLFVTPRVDIFEDEKGITVQAEMPGVSKDHLDIQADRNNLMIEGEAVIELSPGMEPLYADLQATKYRRSFLLSGELETDRIEANLKDGLLTLRIPKRAEYMPRKIEVRSG